MDEYWEDPEIQAALRVLVEDKGLTFEQLAAALDWLEQQKGA